ncbi:MAG: transglutaminase-like domain-containing protein [bacterium]
MRRIIVIASVALTSLLVVAQERVDGAHVLHEFFTGRLTTAGKAEPNKPAEMVEVADSAAPPALSAEPRNGELVYGPDGPLNDGRLKEPYGDLSPFGGPNTLDENTDRVDSLTYFANFDPSVIPFKRVVSQNSVFLNENGEYVVRRVGNPAPSAFQGDLPADSQVFWGSFMLQMESGKLQPIASVAPNQILLEIQTEPEVPTSIFVDPAGNFMLRANYEGPLRVNMRLAVPTTYFTGEFAPTTWAEIDRLRAERLEPRIMAAAQQTLAELAIGRDLRPEEAIIELITYFRNFEARPFPDELRGDDLYVSIVENQIGVCRHRSLAFIVTALALGIPTHYVYNEAHAFVEVQWPGIGWRRVDLGGAANELNASSREDRTVHTPPDSLPKPRRFVEDQERMVQNGLLPNSQASQNGTANSSSQTNGGSATNGGAGQNVDGPVDAPVDALEATEVDNRQAAVVVLDDVIGEARRGQKVIVSGRLTSQNRPLGGRIVEVHLGPPGTTQGSKATLVTSLTTGDDGAIAGEVVIPSNQPVGRWSLFLVFRGDASYKPAFAE